MIALHQFLPACGEGDREAVEGARARTLRSAWRPTPSVSRYAAATSPQAWRI